MPTTKTKHCVTCQAEFSPKSNRQKYCNSCGHYGLATCEICAIEFQVKANTSGRFCGMACSAVGRSAADRRPRPCAICGATFKPRREDQKTCSRACGVAWLRRNKPTVKPCAYCSELFQPRYRESSFCSRACGAAHRRLPPTECQRCGKQMVRSYKDRKYCSVECRRTPVGTSRISGGGYVEIYIGRGEGSANKLGWVFEHRHVMAEHLGRPLLPTETVHHKNGDRADNRIENLELRVGRHGRGATEAHCATCTCFHSDG